MPEALNRSSGVYGLFCLDGAPISQADAHQLGMKPSPTPVSWMMDGHDPHFPTAIHRYSGAEGEIVLVGRIAGFADFAAQLGLARNSPVGLIAATALARYGAQTPAEMLGEYSLLHRDIDGRLTLMIGPARRDRLHYAVAGARVAVASDLFRLARIDWVGNEVDEAGLLSRWGNRNLRDAIGDQTMLSAVRQLGSADSVIIEPDGRTTKSSANVFIPQARWRGTYSDAVAESEDMLRNIIRERIADTARPAILLSGGLDSSSLAWLAATERSPEQIMFALSSAAPAGSGLDDETPFAMQVADHIGVDFTKTVAAEDADFFRPPDKILSGASGPILSNRHCLTEAFQIAAKAGGANMMINGCYGEFTATARLPVTGIAKRLRIAASQIYHGLRGTRHEWQYEGPFLIRLAPSQLANLPASIRETATQSAKVSSAMPARTGLLGYLPGTENALKIANEFYPAALRMDFPFRDMRLLRLFAGFPVAMLLEGGHDRPVVRSMLEGHIPDAIRLRRQGMPAEPDRFYRMQRQASAARLRIADFRRADIDEWIDLDWLDAALLRVATHGAVNNNDTNEVQLTAIAAEFLLWWGTRF